MYFVDDPQAAAFWYAKHLFNDVRIQEESGFFWLETGTVEVGFHPSDQKNPAGGGAVVYWQVEALGRRRDGPPRAGGGAWRGPPRVSAERGVCQLPRPAGNSIGR